ncbi:MAG: cache domain-containing protein, partial [Spirochaetota bacterium]
MGIGRSKSLRIVLSFIVVVIIVLLTAVISISSYNSAVSALKELYINQLINTDKIVKMEVEAYLAQQVNSARELALLSPVKEAVLSRTGTKLLEELIRNKYKVHGYFEEVFISTAEKNPMIFISGNGRQKGLRWGGIGFDANIKNNLEGKPFVSRPGMAPDGKTVVSAVTVPVMQGNTVIGIVGLPVDLGTFSQLLIKDIKIGKTGYVFLTDKAGVAFAHPNKELILNLKLENEEWGKNLMRSRDGAYVEYEWEGKKKYAAKIESKDFDLICIGTGYVSDINDEARTMALLIILVGLAGVAISAVVVYLFISKKLKPLNECKTVLNDMANGNFLSRCKGKNSGDEIGDIAGTLNITAEKLEKTVADITGFSNKFAGGNLTGRLDVGKREDAGMLGDISTALNNAVGNLDDLLSRVIESVQGLAQAVEQISSGNQNLSQRTAEQASSLEEIASTIEETTATIKQNADNANNANVMSDKASKLAEDGLVIVNNAVSSINEISQSSKKIGEIITMINEISFQTNLLALNAAV